MAKELTKAEKMLLAPENLDVPVWVNAMTTEEKDEINWMAEKYSTVFRKLVSNEVVRQSSGKAPEIKDLRQSQEKLYAILTVQYNKFWDDVNREPDKLLKVKKTICLNLARGEVDDHLKRAVQMTKILNQVGHVVGHDTVKDMMADALRDMNEETPEKCIACEMTDCPGHPLYGKPQAEA